MIAHDVDGVRIRVQSSVDGVTIVGIGYFDIEPNFRQSQNLAGLIKNVLNNVERAGDTAADAVELYAIDRAGEVLEVIGEITNGEDDRWYCAAGGELARAIRAMHAATTTTSPVLIDAMRESAVSAILAAAAIVTGKEEHYSPQKAYLAGFSGGWERAMKWPGGPIEQKESIGRHELDLWLHGTEGE